ncbi:MAG: DUF6340 family protein [Bacteroidales bacterium]|nr:DUF6340 family protein [Bacteroidales bacterium]
MKSIIPKISAILLASTLLLSSCGPYLEFFIIDVKVPASYPVDFKEKSVSVFSAIPVSGHNGENMISLKEDSTLMSNFAKGMALSLEKHLQLKEGDIPVFNHFGNEINDIRERSYVEALAQDSESDILVMLENLKIGKFEKLRQAVSPVRSGYASSYVFAPLSLLVNVYDGKTADLISSFTQNDTIYWEILAKEGVNEERLNKGLFSALNKISVSAGEDVVKNFFPEWENEQRCLFIYENSAWRKAHSLAMSFKWKEAMEIWMEDTSSSDNIKASCAAFNIAVACEMLERFDLANEWLDVAQKHYPIEGIDEYKSFLKKK